MTAGRYHGILASDLAAARVAAPEGTPLSRTGGTVREMAGAYCRDGASFDAAGDPVNALAAFFYGNGWLHFGISYGLLESAKGPSCPFRVTPVRPEGDAAKKKLDEKTARYARLLDTARSSVVISGDPATPAAVFAGRVLCIAAAYAHEGKDRMGSGSPELALACFSYGHGWLDAAVAGGLFLITANREIFAV